MSAVKLEKIAVMPRNKRAAAITKKRKPVESELKKRRAKPEPIIPTEDDFKREAERIIGNLKAAWVVATTVTRNEFLEWVEKNKNKTTA